MRPTNVNDLQVSWAIRDIPSSILDFKLKGLLWGLLSIIGNHESCHYSQPQLALILGASERHLKNMLYSLKEKKFIFIKEPDKKGRGYANEYFLNYELILKQPQSVDKQANYAPLLKESRQTMPALSDESRQNKSKKQAQFASQDIQQERYKKRESARKARALSLPVDFSFNLKSENLCREKNLNPQTMVEKFKLLSQSQGKTYVDPHAAFELFIMSEKTIAIVNNVVNLPRTMPADDEYKLCSGCRRPELHCSCRRSTPETVSKILDEIRKKNNLIKK